MPDIQAEIDAAIASTEDELDSLPPEPSQDPVLEVVRLLERFALDVQREIDGQPDLDGLIQTIRPHQEDFRKTIRGTAPYFVPFEGKYAGCKMGPFLFLYDEDDSEPDNSMQESNAIYIDEVYTRALG